MLGLVLSGGGARGAYEAGVLRYVFDVLGPALGREITPRIICGTSIGALTGAWVGALGRVGAVALAKAWQEMEVDHVYHLRMRDLVSWRDPWFYQRTPVGEGQALFDPTPLYQRVRDDLPWSVLHERIDRHDLRAMVVSTTDVMTGRCIHFTDGPILPYERPNTVLRPERIQAVHCLASAAIPLVFPAVNIQGRYYVDGSLRQNTPLLPAILLGADKVLVVGVKRSASSNTQQAEVRAPNQSPTPFFLAGKAIDALLLDDIEDDLRQVQSVNKLLRWGQTAFPDFLGRLEREHRPYRVVDTGYVRPSEDLGRIAAACFEQNRAHLPFATRTFLSFIHNREADDNSDLLSYLFFHKSFTAEIEALGFADAKRDEEALARLVGGV
ncbi:MAG: patatin-like phospholipase family protein [Pseudomonadota bacterium]|nr:patatin-like phospholipase family protein [Pseudomonadota bacterium]